MNFPESIKYEFLKPTKAYSPELGLPSGETLDALTCYSALYNGGAEFEAVKDKFLAKRRTDNKTRSSRLQHAVYTNELSNIVNTFAGTILENSIDIKVSDTAREAYYQNIVTNADGTGRTLTQVAFETLVEFLVSERAYFALSFKDNKPMIYTYTAREIDDWQINEDGNLEYVRIHITKALPKEIGAAPRVQDTWTYISKDAVVTYAIERNEADKLQDTDIAVMIESQKTNYSMIPVQSIMLPASFALVPKLTNQAISLFNTTSNLLILHAQTCLQTLVFKTERPIQEIILSEFEAMKLLPTEDVDFLAPKADVYKELRDQCEQQRKELQAAGNTQTLQNLSAVQHARASAAALAIDHRPLNTLLNCYQQAVHDAIYKLLQLIKEVNREPELEVTLSGVISEENLNEIKSQNSDEKPLTSDPILSEKLPNVDVQATALNGAQMASLQQIIQAVASKLLPADAAKEMIILSFPTVSADVAERMVKSAKDFTPPQPKE